MNLFDVTALQTIYDGFAPGYDQGRDAFDNSEQLEMLAQQIPAVADVLDAGCGSGVPVLSFFANRQHRVTGTDISSAMLALATQHVPSARLMEADSAALDFGSDSFDLITSFYSLFHLDLNAQRRTFASFFKMLRPGGVAYFTLASEEYTGVPEFCGTKVFAGVELPYTHVTPDGYRDLLKGVGFSSVEMTHLSIGGEIMLWVLCRKQVAPRGAFN